MPLVQTRGAASAQGFGEFAQATAVNYIEDVFSTFLYTGNGSAQTITNGIDLSTKGGLTWFKQRNLGRDHVLEDTVRGAGNALFSNYTNAQASAFGGVSSYGTTGFTLDGNASEVNDSGGSYVSWTFRKQPKFFDVVTYTGNGAGSRAIAHNLGSVPGCVIIKKTSGTSSWAVWHRGNGVSAVTYFDLNTTAAGFADASYTAFTSSTTFTVDGIGGATGSCNDNGATYVAYLFAHDAGGFGLTGTDNVISCGSYSGTGATGNAITLGYEPQWVMVKRTDSTADWVIMDAMRSGFLEPNTSDAESGGVWFALSGDNFFPTATGFQINTAGPAWNASGGSYIYIAIRRGPMKVPTDATKVFQAITDTGDTVETSTATFPLDMQFNTFYDQSNATYNNQINDRLRGIGFSPSFTTTPHLTTALTDAATT